MLKLLVQFWQVFKSFYCLTNLQFTKSLKSHLFSQKAIYYDVILMKWFCRLLILFVWIRPRVIMKKKLKSAESCFKRYILGCKYRIGIPTWVLLHLFALFRPFSRVCCKKTPLPTLEFFCSHLNWYYNFM